MIATYYIFSRVQEPKTFKRITFGYNQYTFFHISNDPSSL
jgi:hypothetical protein